MTADAPLDTLVPAELLPEIRKAAEEEKRDPRELVGDAVARYLSERRLFRKDEVHRKIAEGLASLEQGKALDGEAVIDELLSELDRPATR